MQPDCQPSQFLWVINVSHLPLKHLKIEFSGHLETISAHAIKCITEVLAETQQLDWFYRSWLVHWRNLVATQAEFMAQGMDRLMKLR